MGPGQPDLQKPRPRPQVPRPAAAPAQPIAPPAPPPPAPTMSGGWGEVNPFNSIVTEKGFPRVALGAIYDTAKQGLTEETYNNAADAGFGSLRAGPYVASLNQNMGRLQGQMATQASNLADSEANRRNAVQMQKEQIGATAQLQMAQLASEKERLGMSLSSQERIALSSVTEQGRQFDVGMGQRSSEFGADLAFKQQQAEDQRYQNYLAFLFGGANNYTQPTGRVVPGGSTTPTTPSPFSTIAGPLFSGAGMALGTRFMG